MISILIPLYNGVEFLPESLESVINQSYTDWEVIIGVNGHEHNSEVYNRTLSYCSSISNTDIQSKIRVIQIIGTRGKASAMNELLKYTTYDWIAVLDVDDIWLPNKLLKQIPYLDSYDVIGTRCKYFGDLSSIPNIPCGDITSFDFFKVNPLINSSTLIRKDCCYWRDQYNGGFPGLDDYDLWIRLQKDGKSFYNIPIIGVLHRIHNTSSFNAKGNHRYVSELIKLHS